MDDNKIVGIPVLPLRGITVFPNMILDLDIGREKSLAAIQKAMEDNDKILVVAQKDATIDDPKIEELYDMGTIAIIRQVTKINDNHYKIFVAGEKRARIIDSESQDYLSATVEVIDNSQQEFTKNEEALIRTIGELFEKYAKLSGRIHEDMVYSILGLKSSLEIIDIIAAHMTLEVSKKQDILEAVDTTTRMNKIIEILNDEIQILEIQRNIYLQVKKNIDKSQKEYYLKEQLKAIQEELGDKDSIKEETEKYKEKLGKLEIPSEIKEKIEKEIDKLYKTSGSSPESGSVRNYIETVLDIPWGIITKENAQIKKAQKILEDDHYGLEKVKQRILEYLAVRVYAPNVQVPILCLIGPPGVGKTSIAKSIASATGRNYARISLGGARDEADIRGHRRTYVSSMPGRFINALRQAKSMNPVLVLDEMDKMMSDFRGDPAAALLEVLDSEQNANFRDHYIEVPVDLSKVMFICTANTLSSIPKPLLDRMEVIEINSYTSIEKMEIAKRHLLPKQLKIHGLASKNIRLSSENIMYLIDHYTKESGVRSLERLLGSLCRKAVREMLETEKKTIYITPQKIREYLGQEKYHFDKVSDTPQIGLVTGLAWTSVGGDTLSIEVNIMKGKGNLELTGQMGNVMKESAKAAVSYIRSNYDVLEVPENFHTKLDIHIHIPEGAVPKDGPSAGITMATAIISALTKKPVRNDIAMTGEVTIRGRVLAIGGLKEKLLAAKRAGIYNVLVPKQNMPHISEIEKHIVEDMNIIYVETMEEVIKHAFAHTKEEP